MTFAIPDEILLALKANLETLASAIRWPQPSSCLVGQLSSGAASQLAGVPKAYFLSHLADYGVDTFDLTEEETLHDFENA